MADPFSAILGLAGLASQSSWQGAALAKDLENLRFQKRNADRQFRLASAGRTDAYGNKQKYDDLLNEWIVSLTPTQKKITSATEKEQLLSLTEDADRNRQIKVRQKKRGDEAAKDYTTALSEFRYQKPPSEKATRGEFQQMLAGISEAKARKTGTELTRDALRQGRGNFVPQIVQSVNDEIGGDLAENILKARQLGLAETGQREQSHASKYLPLLQQLQSTMDMGGDMPVRMTELPEQLSKQQDANQALILKALENAADNIGGASATTSKHLAAGGADLRGLSSILSSGGGGKSQAPAYSLTSKDLQGLLEGSGSF